MRYIIEDGVTYSVVVEGDLIPYGTSWYGSDNEPLQSCSWNWNKGKAFEVHKHFNNPRESNYTQEAMVVMKGKLMCLVKTEKGRVHDIILNAGDMIVHYRGAHGYEILENDTKCYEIKTGPAPSILLYPDKGPA